MSDDAAKAALRNAPADFALKPAFWVEGWASPRHATFITPGGGLITIVTAHVAAVEAMVNRQDALIHMVSGDTFTVGTSRAGVLRDLGFLPAEDGV